MPHLADASFSSSVRNTSTLACRPATQVGAPPRVSFVSAAIACRLDTRLLFREGGSDRDLLSTPVCLRRGRGIVVGESLSKVLTAAGFAEVRQRGFDPALDSASREQGSLHMDALNTAESALQFARNVPKYPRASGNGGEQIIHDFASVTTSTRGIAGPRSEEPSGAA